ncbi:MAG: hypothetical protein J5J06_09165, partial [Phycisphaerae bacterium]|nr:hypothetical protein [Phycisphaerae bacterium]
FGGMWGAPGPRRSAGRGIVGAGVGDFEGGGGWLLVGGGDGWGLAGFGVQACSGLRWNRDEL